MEEVARMAEGSGAPIASAAKASGVVVLGTGRSGTSAIMRALVASGYFAGSQDELIEPAPSNPTGHYELRAALEINEALLERLDCTWWAEAPPVDKQLAESDAVVPRIRAVVESLIGSAGGRPIAIKEPRINDLLPLWGPVVEGLLHPLLAVRDPLEIAMSLESRDGTTIDHSLAAWEVQTTLALGWLHGRTVTVVPYATLTAEPEVAREVVSDATSHLDPARASRVRPAEAPAALEPNLHRERASQSDHDEYLSVRQAALWEFLSALPAGDSIVEVSPEFRGPSRAAEASVREESAAIRARSAHAAELAEERAAAEYREVLIRESHAKDLADIENSASWRLTAPLRAVKEKLNALGRQR